ncbi:MAG: DUF3237 domain-containing protein [Henriciella sp.]|nr:DUF3237 domain-containing protein [Henriciella sp.]
MRLVPLLTFRNTLSAVQTIGDTPFGQRITYIVGEGRFEGQALNGRILPGGGDWLVKGRDNLARLDVRKTFQTDDEALIHVSYTGLYKFDADVTQRLASGEDCAFGDTLFLTHVQFETGDKRYAWLNETLGVGQGRETQSGVAYEVYAVKTS